MTERLTNVDMDDKMIGKHAETTQGWDVMCSYDISAVNKVIAKEHIKNPVLANTSFSVNKVIPFKYTESFNVKLGNPTITFLAGQSGSCEFSIPVIAGSKVRTTDDSGNTNSIDFPLGYSVAMTVPLANVSGDTVNESGTVITFGDKQDQSVVLHFDTKSGIGDTIAYNPPAATDMDKNILDDFITGFKDNIQDVDYCITTVKSQVGDSASGLTLTPKSFIFTSQVQDSDNPDQGGALNVWIQTNQSGNDVGIHPNPVFQIGTDRYFPIPQNSTAAIFFAKKLIIDKYLQPVLSTIGTIDMTEDPDNVGIQAKLELKNNYTKDYSKTNYGFGYTDFFNCDRVVIDYKKDPIYINLTKNEVKVQWTWSQNIKYSEVENDGGNPFPTTSEGHATIQGSIDKSECSTLKDSSFGIAIDVTKDDVNISSQDSNNGKKFSWSSFLGVFKIDDVQFRGNISADISSQMQSIDLDFGGLNYFAEANIIFAEQAFAASDLSINGDIMLVGGVEDCLS